ncbi:MAG: GxxExxY protein [Bacteroidaceae bacterium]|nr:GxxExxY protein [Bacteroidaceae bacterium]MBR5593075.1 GxxExxY protein [Bacteroidaceae bacterium]
MKAKDPLSYKVIGCAMEVYNVLGPGLLESAYEKALIHELQINGLSVSSQVPVEMQYKGVNLGEGLRLDLLVEDSLIVELKSIDELKPVHYKQLLTYLKLLDKRIGLLINFNVNDFRDGIKRVVNDFKD